MTQDQMQRLVAAWADGHRTLAAAFDHGTASALEASVNLKEVGFLLDDKARGQAAAVVHAELRRVTK